MFLLLASAEATEHHRDIGIDPFAVGGIAIVILSVLMLALLSFGKGREHS
jgi:hypothetical protein